MIAFSQKNMNVLNRILNQRQLSIVFNRQLKENIQSVISVKLNEFQFNSIQIKF